MRLEATVEGSGPDVLIAHGLFGSARNWGAIQKRLASDYRVTAVDMRNHGGSPWDDAHGYEEMADDLAETIDGRAHVVGHSMGGKAAMMLALTQPEKVERLIIADIAPVTYGHTQMHLINAMRDLDLSGIEKRSDADALLAETVAEKPVRAFLLQSLDVRERRWSLNLDILAREMDRIIGWPDVSGGFDGPTLFLTGGDSDYVRRDHRDGIMDLFPNATHVRIPGAGHWLHAEKPREFEAAVRAFLDGAAD